MKIISKAVAIVLVLNLLLVSYPVNAEVLDTPNSDHLVMDDSQNIIHGLNEMYIWSSDEGNSWRQGKPTTKFLGDQTVIVNHYDEQILLSSIWAPIEYPAGAYVTYDGALWTNVWWAGSGDIPQVTEVPGSNPWQKVKDLPQPLHIFNFTKFTGQEAVDFQQRELHRIQNEKKVIGYFANWHGYKTDYQPNNPEYNYSQGVINGKGFDPVDAPYDLITHINYAFMVIATEDSSNEQNPYKRGDLISNDPWADYDASYHSLGGRNYINQVIRLAEDNDVYSMVSIGGWNNSVYDRGFDIVTETPEMMDRFTDQIVDFVVEFGFDGVDIDWEYPENNDEKEKFVALIKQLREKLTAAGMERDIYYQLSIAITANHQKMEFIDPTTVNNYVDSFNVMSYDFRGGFSTQTGHHSPLYASPNDDEQKFNIDSAMKEYETVFNIPKNKLMVGFSNYSRGFANVNEGIIGAQSSGTFVAGTWDDPNEPAGLMTWFQLKELEEKAKGDNITVFYNWDNDAKAPFIYDSANKRFYTYDNLLSTSHKVNYVIDSGYGGAIIWELAFDTQENKELTSLTSRILTGAKIDIEEPEIPGPGGNLAELYEFIGFDTHNHFSNHLLRGMIFEVSKEVHDLVSEYKVTFKKHNYTGTSMPGYVYKTTEHSNTNMSQTLEDGRILVPLERLNSSSNTFRTEFRDLKVFAITKDGEEIEIFSGEYNILS